MRWVESCRRAWRAAPDDADVPRLGDLTTLAFHLHDVGRANQGLSWRCDATLAAHVGCSPRSIQRAMRLLERAELLTRHRGETAYWTARAYGGDLPDGRYRVVQLAPFCPRLAHTPWESDVLRAARAKLALRRVSGQLLSDAGGGGSTRRVDTRQGGRLNPPPRGRAGPGVASARPPTPPNPEPVHAHAAVPDPAREEFERARAASPQAFTATLGPERLAKLRDKLPRG